MREWFYKEIKIKKVNYKILKIFIVVVVVAVIGFIVQQKFFEQPEPIFCTMEAKLCSDGSYVGRSGPKCEFASCSKENLIRVFSPRANEEISSPFLISGEARGNWFFEASFPIRLFDANNREISVTIGEAQTNWMVIDFVPFKATLIFETPSTPTGTLIFEKDNPSGLLEHADELRMPIKFSISDTDKATTLDNGIMGQVLVGPQCPVVKIEDENCKDKPYPTSIEISLQNAPRLFRLIDTDSEAKFKIALEPGVYILRPKGGNPFPGCSEEEVLVSTHKFQNIILSCDTGIR